MKYFKSTNNNPFVFEDNVTAEIIAKVEATHNTTLTEITRSEYEALIAPSLDELKQRKVGELTQSYTTDNQQDISFMSTTFQADDKSQGTLSQVLSVGSVPDGFYWLDANNVEVPMSYTELQGFAGVILLRSQANFTKLQGLKQQVSAARDETELDGIVW